MSEQSIGVLSLTHVAASAVTQYQAIGFDGAPASVAGARIMGFAETKADQNRAFTVRVMGTATALAGVAITRGDALAVDVSGALVPAQASDAIVGDALENAAQGSPFEVLIAR